MQIRAPCGYGNQSGRKRKNEVERFVPVPQMKKMN